MPKANTVKKRKEKRRTVDDPIKQFRAHAKARSRKAQAKKGKKLFNTSLSRGRTVKKGKPGSRNTSLTRSASEKKAAAATAIRLSKMPVSEARPTNAQGASWQRNVSSRSFAPAARNVAGQRKSKKDKQIRKTSVSASLTPAQAFVRNQIDKTTNIQADQGSMNRIFENSQPMPAAAGPTRKAMAGARASTNQALGPSSSRTAVESALSISPVFQCRVAINSIFPTIPIVRAEFLSSVPYGFTMTSGGQSGAMAANVMNSGVTINRSQWNEAFNIIFGKTHKQRKSKPYTLSPPPDPRGLNNNDYIEQSRDWKLTYSWMTMLPLLWGVNPDNSPPPLHCEHKLPLFWLAAFGCGPETKLAMFSNISVYSGIVEEIQRVTRETIPDIRAKIQARIGVGAASDMSAFEGSGGAIDPAIRRARVSAEYVSVKHTVREECYAWEFPCVNSAIKSQMVFINLILGDDGQLYYVIAKQAISNYVEGLATNTSTSCIDMWYTILMNILQARGVNISNWKAVSEAVGSTLNRPGDVVTLIQRAAASSGEGIIGLVNNFLSPQQKQNIPRRQYTKQYIYDSMVVQLLKLTSLLNNTVNQVCDWGSSLPDGGIRNNLYLNYIRIARFCESNPRYADKVGATQDSDGHWNQPTTGMFTMLRNLRNETDRAQREDADLYISQIQNANGQLTISTGNLTQRGGSLILPRGSQDLDLGNSYFSIAVNDAANEPLEFQAEVDDAVDLDAADEFGGYDADDEQTSGSDFSPHRSPSLRRQFSDVDPNALSRLRQQQQRMAGELAAAAPATASGVGMVQPGLSPSSNQIRTSPVVSVTPIQASTGLTPGSGELGDIDSGAGIGRRTAQPMTGNRDVLRRQLYDTVPEITRQDSIDPGYMGSQSQQLSLDYEGGSKKKKKKKKKTKKKRRRRKKRTRRK
jgi:hypothetical protein